MSNTIYLLNFLGAAQGAFLSGFLFFHRKGNVLANRALALIIFSVAMFCVDFLVHQTRLALSFPHTAFAGKPLGFAIGPLVYGYVLALKQRPDRLDRRYLLHFVPMFVMFAYLAFAFHLRPTADKLEILRNWYGMTPEGVGKTLLPFKAMWLTYAVHLHFVVYIVAAIHAFDSIHNSLRERARASELARLKVIQIAFFGFLAIWAIDLFLVYFSILVYNLFPAAGNFVSLLISIQIYVLVYLGLKTPHAFSFEETNSRPKYQNSGLTAEQVGKYVPCLLDLMEKEKIYRDPELTMKVLADRLGVLERYLSQIINQEFKKRFPDFVNEYRTREAVEHLQNPSNNHLTVLAIGYEAGFNSKATFNAAFKKNTGLTPSQFRRTARSG